MHEALGINSLTGVQKSMMIGLAKEHDIYMFSLCTATVKWKYLYLSAAV
jgi:hypothetical protein